MDIIIQITKTIQTITHESISDSVSFVLFSVAPDDQVINIFIMYFVTHTIISFFTILYVIFYAICYIPKSWAPGGFFLFSAGSPDLVVSKK